MTRRFALCCVCAIAVLAGLWTLSCKGEGSESERISETILEFYRQMDSGDPPEAYKFLDRETKKACDRQKLTDDWEHSQQFAQQMDLLLGQYERRLTIESFTWRGDRGEATVRLDLRLGSMEVTHRLFRESGKWHLDYDCGQFP